MQERDLADRIERLEERLRELEERWADEQRRVQRQRQRERWLRLGGLVLVAVAYLVYLKYVTSIPG